MIRAWRIASSTWVAIVACWLAWTIVDRVAFSGPLWPVLVTGIVLLPTSLAMAWFWRRVS